MNELNIQTGMCSELNIPGQSAFLPWDFKSMAAPEIGVVVLEKPFQERRDKIVMVEKKGK